ncbi:MAG: type II toxin-antitoxin system VapC family toxin [Bryobacteraceae bacterium]
MTTYLLDTDIAIELLRGRNVHVAGQLAARNRNAVFLSTVTVAELVFGALRSREPQKSIAICRQFCRLSTGGIGPRCGRTIRRHQGGSGRTRRTNRRLRCAHRRDRP